MSTAQPTRRESFWPNHFCPCGVVQLTRLPLMQEITGAKPVRDANFHVPKAFSAMHSFGMGASSVQFRVGAPNSEWWQRASNRRRTSVQAGVISQPSPGQHWGLRSAFTRRATADRPFSPPCPDPSGRISFVKKLSRSTPARGTTTFARVVQQQRHDVENVASVPTCRDREHHFGLQALK